MARRPVFSADLRNRLPVLDASEVTALSRLPTMDTTDEDFGEIFKQNPTAALAAKGIDISAAEADSIKTQLNAIGGRGGGGNPLATEVKVGVTVKF